MATTPEAGPKRVGAPKRRPRRTADPGALARVLDGLDTGVVVLDQGAAAGDAVVSANPAARALLASCGVGLDAAALAHAFEADEGTAQFGMQLVAWHRVPAGALSVLQLRDVTENARLEAIAQAVNVMDNTGSIFSCVRHELGNPLNSVKTILRVLQNNLDHYATRTIDENISWCLAEIGRMELLLRSLKSFSLYERPALEKVEIPSFVSGFLRIVGHQLSSNKIRLRTRFDRDAQFVRVDPRALTQVLHNIVVNAMDALAGRPEPEIGITSARCGETVRLAVVDNGAGMAPEQRRRLFQAFQSTKPHGSGLGLVIARKLLTKMNCQIEVDSSPGAGTTVTLTLPAHPEESPRPRP